MRLCRWSGKEGAAWRSVMDAAQKNTPARRPGRGNTFADGVTALRFGPLIVGPAGNDQALAGIGNPDRTLRARLGARVSLHRQRTPVRQVPGDPDGQDGDDGQVEPEHPEKPVAINLGIT